MNEVLHVTVGDIKVYKTDRQIVPTKVHSDVEVTNYLFVKNDHEVYVQVRFPPVLGQKQTAVVLNRGKLKTYTFGQMEKVPWERIVGDAK